MKRTTPLLTLFATALLAVAFAQTPDARFERLMRDLLILDSHIDTPGYVVDEGYQLTEEHRYYETDIPRLKRGKVDVAICQPVVQRTRNRLINR